MPINTSIRARRKYRNESCSPPSIISVIKSKIKFAVHIEQMEETANPKALNRLGQKDLRGKDHFGNSGIDGRMLLRWFIKK